MLSRMSSLSGPISPIPSRYIVARGLRLFLDAGDSRSYSGTGTAWNDISGNGVNFTLRGGTGTASYAASNGGILVFNSGSYHFADTASNLGDLNQFTVESWIRWDGNPAAGTNAVVTNIYDGVSKVNFALGACEPASATVRAGFFNGAWRNVATGHTPTLNTWYHYAGTYNGSTVTLYVNTTTTYTLSYSGTPQSGGAIRIARRWDEVANVSTNFTHGAIPVVRIYNRALSLAELQQNFNAQRSRYGV